MTFKPPSREIAQNSDPFYDRVLYVGDVEPFVATSKPSPHYYYWKEEAKDRSPYEIPIPIDGILRMWLL